jgi:hypothetical protein
MRRRPLARTAVNTAVIAGTATAVSGRVARRQQASAQQQAATQQAAAPPPPPAAAPAPAPAAPAVSGDMVEQLTALAGLRDQGILTEEEFTAQKAKILGS